MNKYLEIGLYSLGSAAIASLVTMHFTRQYMQKKYMDQIESETAEIKEHYRSVIAEQKTSMRNELEKEVFQKVITDLGYQSEDEVEEEAEELDAPESQPVTVNIWNTPQLTEEEYRNGVGIDPEPDEPEDAKEGLVIPRGRIVEEPNYPFTITTDDYFNPDPDADEYDKITLTYYELDDVLADDRDEVIDDVEGTIGPDALESFGHLSNDPSICYVRNRDREADFEIIKNAGSYSVIVHGMDPEDLGLTSKKNRPKKMREDE